MTIIQSPATYNFAGNIPDLIVDTTEQLSFTLSRGGTQIVAETYTPAQNDRIVINLRNLLELLVEVPGYEEVATPIAQYTYTLGSTTGTFYCLPGGHGAAVSAESFLRGNFLTWQPQTRVTLYHTPHRLRYAALAACVCKVKGYFTDGTSAVISLLTMSAGNIYTMDVSFGTIRGKFDTQPTYYDVWVENTTGQAMTWGQRYMLADFEAGTNDYFIFANSLGGFDTIRFSGDRKEINKLESVNAIFDDQTLEYDIDRTRSWKKYTGYIADEQLRMWVLDFFNSPQRYHLTDSGALQRIYVSEPKLEDTAGETAGYEFTYAYSRQSRYINLERAETPQLLEITDPASEVFFLAPRLNQFEAADPASSADYLIPIQAAAADKWLAISLASLLDYIKPTGIDVDALQDYLTDHKYATQAWVSQQNFLTTAALDNYLLKSVWDEVFEITTENGVRVLNVKLDIVGLKGISAYGLGSTSGGSASGSLGELVNVGQWADAVPTADRVMVQLAGATHWSAKPLADLVGLDTAALAQYLTANSYLKASDISSYLTWANLSGKPTVYPTSWELVADKPTVYPTAWTSVTGRPTKLSQFTDDVVAGNYLPKPTWDAVFEVVTVDGTPALKVKYDILGLKGITAYADGSLSGGFSGALVDLVDVAVTNLASGDILKYNGTHFVNVPVSSIAGASSWDQITGKPEYYPTRWADVSGAPTSLPASDVYPWAKAGSKPTYTAAEVGALPLSGGKMITGDFQFKDGVAVRDYDSKNIIGLLNIAGDGVCVGVGNGIRKTRIVTPDDTPVYRNDSKGTYRIYDSGNFNPSSKLDKSVWDEAFEIKTVDGVRVISAKLDFLSVAGISAYATGPSSGGGGGGLDYDLLKQALTGAITPDGYPFTISASFLGAIGNTYLPLSGGTLTNTGNSAPLIITGSSLQACTKYMMNGSTVSGYFGVIAQGLNGAFMQYANGTISPSLIINNDAAPRFINTAGTQFALYHSGNFNPDDKFGFSAAQLSDLNNAPNNAFFVGAHNAANAPVADSWSNGFTIAYGNNPDFRKQFCYAGEKWWTRGRDGVNWGTWRQIWDSGNFNPNNYLPLTGNKTITGSLTVANGFTSGIMKCQTGVYPQLQFEQTNTGVTSILFVHTNNALIYRPVDPGSDYTVYHSGNFNPGNYLLLSGGTMTGDITFGSNGSVRFSPDNGNIAGVMNLSNTSTPVTVIGTDVRPLILLSSEEIYRSTPGSIRKSYKIYDSGNFNPDNYLLKTANAVSASKWATTRTLTLTGSASGNVSMDGSANVSLSVTNNRLNSNSEMTYGWNGINYFNIYGTAGAAAKTNDTPTTAWWHILRFNHGNSAGYYTDLAVPFNDNTLHYKRVTSGTLQNGGWVKIWDARNSNLSTVDWAAKNITAAGTIVSMSTVESRGNNSTGILPQMLWHLPGVSYTRIRMASDGGLHILNGGSEAYQNLYAQNLSANNTVTATKLVIGGITIDVYNGALRVNGNLVATGGVTAYQ